jgi:hypothetical protein
MTPRRSIPLALLVALAIAAAARAQAVDSEKVAKIKSAFVLNFVRFSEWPPAAFEQDDSPIRVAVVAAPGVETYLPRLVEGATIGKRRVVVEAVPLPGSGEEAERRFVQRLRGCHVVYLGTRARDQQRRVLESLSADDALLVGDTPGFASAGGMLGLVLEEDRVVFEANRDAIDRSRVTVSSKVLKLARIVKEES